MINELNIWKAFDENIAQYWTPDISQQPPAELHIEKNLVVNKKPSLLLSKRRNRKTISRTSTFIIENGEWILSKKNYLTIKY